MTHGGFLWFVPMELQMAFVLAVVLLPATMLAAVLYRKWRPVGYGAIGLTVVSYVMMLRLWIRHAQLETAAAKKAGCMGYAQLPERCVDAMNGAHVTPDGFFAWSAFGLSLSVAGLAVVLYQTTDWQRYRKKLAGLRPVMAA